VQNCDISNGRKTFNYYKEITVSDAVVFVAQERWEVQQLLMFYLENRLLVEGLLLPKYVGQIPYYNHDKVIGRPLIKTGNFAQRYSTGSKQSSGDFILLS
jgi:hypothetical protein